MAEPHILLVDLYSGGHHAGYISELVSYWVRKELSGVLEVVVPESYREKHRALCDYISNHDHKGLRLAVFDSDADRKLGAATTLDLLTTDLAHGRIARRYISSRRPTHCVLMFLDHAQLSLATDLRFQFDVRISGVYFRPTFHYAVFDTASPAISERLSRRRKRTVLGFAARNRHLTHIFSLDPFAVPHIQALSKSIRAVHLPDPISLDAPVHSRETVQEKWGVEPNRLVALFFGVVDGRKGIHKVLEAVRRLPGELQADLFLAIAGPIDDRSRSVVQQDIDRTRKTSRVQIGLESRFIPAGEVPSIFGAADVALVTYQRHTGSSNVLLRAAACGIPVIGSDYGLVGATIRSHQLGVAIDATSAQAISDQLATFLRARSLPGFDRSRARQHAVMNSAHNFAETIFTRIRDDN